MLSFLLYEKPCSVPSFSSFYNPEESDHIHFQDPWTDKTNLPLSLFTVHLKSAYTFCVPLFANIPVSLMSLLFVNTGAVCSV